ncbi:MAG: FecR domain-containing protein [Bacteroidota bacterium]
MKTDKHPSSPLPEEDRLFSKLGLPFSTQKEDKWTQMQLIIEEEINPFSKKRQTYHWMIAASVVLLLCLSVFRFYSTEITARKGETIQFVLPDGSTVHLNASSRLRYHPLWWWANRAIQLEGEAYFEVKKGSRFEVSSKQGKTSVLGTKFNIFSRENAYEVFCSQGVVTVSSPSLNQVDTLRAGDFTVWAEKGWDKKTSYQDQNPTAWTAGEISYSQQSLLRVLKELERTYDISIRIDESWASRQISSGRFTLPEQAEQVLKIVCAPFDIRITKISVNEFSLSNNRHHE